MHRKNYKLTDRTLPSKAPNDDDIHEIFNYKLTDRASLSEAPNDDDICKTLKNIKSVCEEKHNQTVEDIEKLNKNELLIDSMVNEQLTDLADSASKETIDLKMMIKKITKVQELIKKRPLQNSNCEIDYDDVD